MNAPSNAGVDDSLITLVPLKVDPSVQNPTPITFDGPTPPNFTTEDLSSLNQLARVLLSNPNAIFPPPPVPQPNERSTQVAQAKEEGNKFFRVKNWSEAIKYYTLSADIAASRPVFEAGVYARDELALTLSNRSAAYMGAGQYVNALCDADAVIQIKRPWMKGHFRRGKALAAMGRLREAREAFLLGLQFDPTAEEVRTAVEEVNKQLLALQDKKDSTTKTTTTTAATPVTA
ncbi:BQ2448_1674 [Microbotryum intermedium]|uniref:BQ2448_1674 protein n=1 Tax=Microbotryum intermedium TaxID=269621 RepID=A0A238F8V7_9BASI|nr:BQ2448_1674 [Microbotryum intermedium]